MSRNWLLILIGSSWTAKPLGQGGHFWMCNMITTRMMAAWCKSSWSEALKWSPNWKSLLSTQSRCCLLLCCSCTCQNCEKRFFWSQNNMLTGIWSLICRYLQQNELYDNCKMCVRSQINTWFAPKQYIVYALFCQRKTTNQAMSASVGSSVFSRSHLAWQKKKAASLDWEIYRQPWFFKPKIQTHIF